MDFIDLRTAIYQRKAEAEKWLNSKDPAKLCRVTQAEGYIKACEDILKEIKPIEAKGTLEQRMDNLVGEVKQLREKVVDLENMH